MTTDIKIKRMIALVNVIKFAESLRDSHSEGTPRWMKFDEEVAKHQLELDRSTEPQSTPTNHA